MSKTVSKVAAAVSDLPPRPEELFAIPGAALYQTPDGREIPDPTPIAPPVGYKKSIPLHEQIKQMIRSERMAQLAEEMGAETFEESEDFEIGDDYDPRSPWENDFDPTLPEIRDALIIHKETLGRHKEAAQAAGKNPPSDGPDGTRPSEGLLRPDGEPSGQPPPK